MCHKNLFALLLLLSLTGVCVAGNSVVPTTTLAAQTANNTSAANAFKTQSNGNLGASNISKVDVHSLLYSGSTTKIYAHMLLWFGGPSHMNVGYNSDDAAQVHRQITDMISRGIDGVIIDWYGPSNTIDDATKLVMAEAETHPGFTFAIMIDQGAIEWYSCSGCSPQQALVNDLQYIEQTYFSSPAYMQIQGKPVVTNFNVDLSYSVDWNAANAALSTPPALIFQNNNGFQHVLSDGSYSWVMPTTTDYGIGYLSSFYNAGMPYGNEQTVGATYKGFNDTLASWGSNRIMGQQCGQTWLQTFSEVNNLYNSGKQLPALQLVTWNDYEEATEIESGINNCLSVSASASGNSLQWTVKGDENTVDHYVPYISIDGQNLMPLNQASAGTSSLNLCSYSIPNGTYTAYVQAVGKASVTNQMSAAVKVSLNCPAATSGDPTLTLTASPNTLNIASGGQGQLTVTVAPESGTFSGSVALTCSGLPKGLSCSFAPSSIAPGKSGATSVLTIVAASSVSSRQSERRTIFLAMGIPGLGGLFGIAVVGSIKRCRVIAAAVACVIAVVILATSSCGKLVNPVNPSSTAPSDYAVNVNGATGSVQLSTTVMVTVK